MQGDGTTPRGTGGATRAFLEPAAESVAPLAGGIAGAKAGAAVGAKAGAAIGTAFGPAGTAVGATAGTIIGAIGGGVTAGFATARAQDAVITGLVGEERRRQQLERRQAQRDEHPIASFAGEVAPLALAFRPSPDLVRRTGGVLRDVTTQAGRSRLARRPEELFVAADVVGGGAVAGGVEASRQIAEGQFRPVRLAAETGVGALFADPTRIGQRLGLRAHPTQAQAMMNRRERARAARDIADPERITRRQQQAQRAEAEYTADGVIESRGQRRVPWRDRVDESRSALADATHRGREAVRQSVMQAMERGQPEAVRQGLEAHRTAVTESLAPLPQNYRTQAERIIARTERPEVMMRAAQRAVNRYERDRSIGDLRRVLGSERRQRTVDQQQLERFREGFGDIDARPRPLTATERQQAVDAERALASQPSTVVPKAVRNNIRRLRSRRLEDMSSSEIREAADAIRAARHLSTQRVSERNKERTRIANQIISEVGTQPRLRIRRAQRLAERISGTAPHAPVRSGLGVVVRELATRPETIMAEMSDTLRRFVWERIGVDAYRDYLSNKQQIIDGLEQTMQEAGRPIRALGANRWMKETVATGTLGNLTRYERIHLATTLMDPDNAAVALRNGLRIDRLRRRIKMTQRDIDDLTSGRVLDGAESAAVRYMFRSYNSTIPATINPTWRREYGHDLATRSDYAPRRVEVDPFDLKQDPARSLEQFRERAVQDWGAAKERVGTRDPIRVGNGFDVFLSHVDNATRIGAYLSPANDALKVLSSRRVKDAIVSRYGESGHERLIDAIRMQTVPVVDKSPIERVMRRFMRMYGASVLGLRLSTMLLNPSGMFTASPYVGFGNMARAAAEVGPNPAEHRRIAELARQYSPYYRERYDRNFVHETLSGMAAGNERRYGGISIAEAGMRPIQWSDQFGGNIRWRAAERHVAQSNPNLQQGTPEFYQRVAREWEMLMYRSENTGHGMEMTGALAYGRKNPFFSPLVLFTSSVSKIYSGAVRAHDLAAAGRGREALPYLIGFVGSVAFAVGVREMLSAGRGTMGDDDRPLAQQAIHKIAAEAAGQVPVLGPQVLQPSIRSIGNGRFWTFEPTGHDVLRAAGMGMTESIAAANAWWDETVNADGEAVAHQKLMSAIERFATVAARATGTPIDGPQDALRIARNMTVGLPADDRSDIMRHLTREVDQLAREDGRLTAADQRAEVQQGNGRIFRAIREHAPGTSPDADVVRMFADGVRRRQEAGQSVDPATLRSIIQGRYARFTRLARDEEAVGRLPAEARDMLNDMILERDRLLEALEELMLMAGGSDRPRPRRGLLAGGAA